LSIILGNIGSKKKDEKIKKLEKSILVNEKINTLQKIPILPTDKKKHKRKKRRANRKINRIQKLNNF
jgi:hypothetical protein